MSKFRTFRLNKLVRDGIIEFTTGYGGSAKYKVLNGRELNEALINKLIEEARELKNNGPSVEELADLQEIISQIAKNLKITDTEIMAVQDKKRSKNGGFTKGHFIKTLTAPADSKWAEYYGSDPKRFPEVK
jgi:predicted house-cleaning noncanonical NTP pyrophosphatase (MazG superfamily)